MTTYALTLIICWAVPIPDGYTAGGASPERVPACYQWRTHDDARYPTEAACEAQARWWRRTPVLIQQTLLMSLRHGGAPERVVSRCDMRVLM